jgi:four helix bundle protein
MAMAQNPNNLKVLGEAQVFCRACITLIERIQKRGDFRLKEQIEASTTSVPANLMEFCSMDTRGAKLQKIGTCIGESYETESRLKYCRDKGILSEVEYDELQSKNVSIRKQLCGLKKAVERS